MSSRTAKREVTTSETAGGGAHVIRSLKRWMEEGVLIDGQPLPSERVLSEELGVARNTVRRALAILEEDGMLRTRSGGARIVTLPKSSWRGLIGECILVLTRWTDQAWVNHRASGWEEYVTHGVLHAVRAAGLHAVSLQWGQMTEAGIQNLIAARPRGVVITDASRTNDVLVWSEALREAEIPFTIYGGMPATAGFDRVCSDHEAGAYQLTRWLLERGTRRVFPLWTDLGLQGYWAEPRHRGYERAVREAGLEPLPTLKVPFLIQGDEDNEAWFWRNVESVAEYLQATVKAGDALMLDSDGHVRAAAAACRRLGLVPQRDVLLTGYDNYWSESPESAWEPTIPLATVDKQNLKMGAELMQLLMDRLEGRLPSAPQSRVVVPQVVVPGK